MRYVTCNLCGADDFNVVFPKHVAQIHRIVRCNRCDLMYSNPQELIDCEAMTQDTWVNFDPTSPHCRQYFQKQQVQLPDNLRALKVLNDLFPKRGKLLEIGSFAGIFLDQIRTAGWDVTGLEPDCGPANYSRSHFKLNIVSGLLPHPKLAAGTFDAVVLLHVVEHLPNPAETLRHIRNVMKKGGVFVVETPRFDSLSFKLLGRRERSLSNCNGHIYFFTVSTLTRLLEQNGFEVLRVDLVGRTLTMDRLAYNLGVISRSTWVKNVLGRLSAMLRLDKFRLHINVRDMQRIYCRAN